MRKGRLIVFCLTAVFIFLIAAVFFAGTNLSDETLTFVVQSGDSTERIKCWEDEEGKLYVFLPTYAQISDVKVNIPRDGNIFVDGIAIENGMSCEAFLLNKEYDLSGSFLPENLEGKLIFVQSGNMPTMYIETKSGSTDFINQQKGNSESGRIRLYDEKGKLDYKGELESIKGRGNTTWMQPKKPYSIKLSSAGDLLNMGKASNWILLSNYLDHSNLMNKISYDFAREIGMKYTPDCQWVDLYLNGEYAGLYLLTERIEIHSERVDIADTGSFLVSKDVRERLNEQGHPYISIKNNEDINIDMSLRIHDVSISEYELTNLWETAVETILNGGDYKSIIDIDSWAMRMLVDEIFVNGDSGLASQYFYGNLYEGKIYAGPVWDMDVCLADLRWPCGDVSAIISFREHLSRTEDSLLGKLYQDPEFHDRMIHIYKTKMLPVLSKLLDEKFMREADIIAQASCVNSIRWNIGSFWDDVEENYDFLKERVAFLNKFWEEEENYCMVQIEPGWDVWGCLAVKRGECIPDIYGLYRINEWYVLETEEVFDITQPVYEDVAIFYRDQTSDERKSENVAAETYSIEPLRLQRTAPIFILLMLMLLMYALDNIRRKK